MEYISAEEFLKQPLAIQKVFVDWWQPSVGDLIGIKTECIDMSWNTITKYKVSCVNEDDLFNYNSKEELLDSFKVIGGQSYSNKTNASFEINFSEDVEPEEYKRCMSMYSNKNDLCIGTYQDLDCNLLQAYWKVACKIASKED
ncbi:hypothetical protein SR42_15295 [Clostridium botulinum]|uniref:hypothetical protein n=1 Tax=Clostridium botulinum TaxID=1491 RepID=UPI000596F3E3|nr:hypothetical protein [Clostridium botulinum]KIL06927.1 hypothetical protein SR42_15295 [Clostridium botulinum]MBY6935268.1 hypothetical protein [Clostridium botulinum]NFL82098.1 hypothetical protein [Clostridium botulinum]NFN12687.1 hypothetical protein [Clostridium botulinum]NFO37896.1 hypothetical protein [Clostridium botulinum]